MGMATQLVTKRCDLGSLGVLGPASTPLGRRGRATSSIDPKLDLDLDISDLGFDQISSYKRGGSPNPHPQGVTQVCWLGPEPQGTPSHTFLPPNGSPSHHLGL